MAKKDKMIAYDIFKAILSPIYKIWYNPIIIGKENIPEEGRFILAGNHVNIMDQCNVIIATKRHLHYMAKKEYFDNKMVAWFFKISGCIPVDRSKKDESATSSAMDVLNKDEALGIFPEGTRNGVKEEYAKKLYKKYIDKESISFKSFYKKIKKNKTSQVNYLEKLLEDKKISKKELQKNLINVDDYLKELITNKKISTEDYYNNILLPLKFGAVSLAKKTKSKIVPYAITGEYKLRSKNLKIIIGKPIKPKDDLEKFNKELENSIKELLKKSYEIENK